MCFAIPGRRTRVASGYYSYHRYLIGDVTIHCKLPAGNVVFQFLLTAPADKGMQENDVLGSFELAKLH